MISVNNYGEEKVIKKNSAFRFNGTGGHLGFSGTHQGTHNFKTVSQMVATPFKNKLVNSG